MFGQVCQRLIVLSYWTPGSAHAQAAFASWPHRSFASYVEQTWPVVARDGLPRPAGEHGAHEVVGHADRVVRVLSADGVVGLAVEVARVAPPMSAWALCSSRTFQLMKSAISGWSMSRHTIFAARRVVPPLFVAPAARSKHLEEAHQAARRPAAGELLLLAADGAEVRARPRAVLEEARLALHELVDAHEVVADRLDEARRALRALVGAPRLVHVVGPVDTRTARRRGATSSPPRPFSASMFHAQFPPPPGSVLVPQPAVEPDR